jgi:hypothetical protein
MEKLQLKKGISFFEFIAVPCLPDYSVQAGVPCGARFLTI